LESPFVNKVKFGEYYHGRCDLYSVKSFVNFGGIPASGMRADTDQRIPNHTASHRSWPQASHTSASNLRIKSFV